MPSIRAEWAVSGSSSSMSNDLTIGWQNLNLLSHSNATLAPRQVRTNGENLNYVTLAPQAGQARPSCEILNYLLSCYSDILKQDHCLYWWFPSNLCNATMETKLITSHPAPHSYSINQPKNQKHISSQLLQSRYLREICWNQIKLCWLERVHYMRLSKVLV